MGLTLKKFAQSGQQHKFLLTVVLMDSPGPILASFHSADTSGTDTTCSFSNCKRVMFVKDLFQTAQKAQNIRTIRPRTIRPQGLIKMT
jgi:hypothetical protein